MNTSNLNMLKKNIKTTLSSAIVGTALLVATGASQANSLVPSSGRVLMVGQDGDSINQYVAAMGSAQTPGGIIEYLNLTPDLQDGKLDVLAQRYPNSALSVGVPVIGRLPEITSGALDWRLKAIINKLKSYNRPVYLRMGHEFEGEWNSYDPTQYQAMFRRVHTLIQQQGASKHIALVWQAAAHCGTTFGNRTIEAWYPGDRFVDYVGLSYFTPGLIAAPERGTCTVRNQRVDEVANFARAHAKPIMVAESTVRGFSTSRVTWQQAVYGGAPLPARIDVPVADINLWFKNFFAWVAANDVKVVSYINADWDSQPIWANQSWGDSRVQANTAVRAYWTGLTSTGFLKANNGVFKNVGFAPTTNTIMVRARGVTGAESVTLRVNNVAVKTWTLSKNTTETAIQTTLNGKVTLHFTNDTATNDVQVDYVNVNGNVRQAKYQPINTGVYQGNVCGGVGPNGTGRSEWLNCNGYIDFDATTTVVNQPIEIVVRGLGTLGGEKVQLLTGNTIAKEWTLTTALSDTSITVPKSTSDVAIRFINDGAANSGDVQIDYIKVNDDVRQAEDATFNTGVYQGGQCGGIGPNGSGKSEWLNCNGLINFGPMQPF